MEMTGILCLALAAAAAFAVWKSVQVKKDIYEYTKKLEAAIGRMLKNEELEEVPGEKDDLWGKMYGRLVRLSRLYANGLRRCGGSAGRSWKKRIR